MTKTSHEIDVHVGPTGAQTCTVVYDLYTPSSATKATPAPAILSTNGFGGSKDDQADLGQAFAERGYVVLSYSGLGFGGSDCQISLDDPDYDGRAAQQLVTYLGGGSAANDGSTIDYVKRDAKAHDGKAMANDPRVGMVGGSYGGQVQFAVAGIDPRVDAIVPIITWNDLAYSLAPNNTDAPRGVTYTTPGTEKVGWTSLFFGVGIADGIEFASTDPTRNVGCPNFVVRRMCGEGADGRGRLSHGRHTGVRAARERVVVRQQGPHPHPAHAGRERHAVQPAGGGCDLPGAAGAGHRDEDDLAVLGAQRRHARPGRARHAAPASRAMRDSGSSPGSSAT